jgi:hypothetical protein
MGANQRPKLILLSGGPWRCPIFVGARRNCEPAERGMLDRHRGFSIVSWKMQSHLDNLGIIVVAKIGGVEWRNGQDQL